MKHLDLFSGIGGFAIAAREVWDEEYECVGFCDHDWFCQQVLTKNFPGVPIYEDIRTVTNAEYTRRQRQETLWEGRLGDRRYCRGVDLITGGFPCQPFSAAGLRKGTADERHLWPEMLRIVREFQPAWVIAENVGGLITWNDGLVFETVCADLEAAGYEVQPFLIPAAAVGAPHRRDRVWFVAHATGDGYIGEVGLERQPNAQAAEYSDGDSDASNPASKQTRISRQPWQDADGFIADARRLRGDAGRPKTVRPEGEEPKRTNSKRVSWDGDWREVAFATCFHRMDDGLSERLVRFPDGTETSEAKWRKEALKAYGNAIVPQVAAEIMRAMKEVM